MPWTARQTVDGATYYIDVTNGQIALHNPGKGSRDRSVEKWCWMRTRQKDGLLLSARAAHKC